MTMTSHRAKQMHIGLNAHLLAKTQTYRSAGVSGYIYHLLRQLAQEKSPYRYTALLHQAEVRASERLQFQRSLIPTHKPWLRIGWEQTAQPLWVRRLNLDLLHSLAFVSPLIQTCPSVLTIYDLTFMHYPDAFRPFNRWYLQTMTRHSAKHAQAITTISESTRRDVIRFFDVDPRKVFTVYCGVDDSFYPRPPAEVAAFRQKHSLPDPFILYLGTLEPRKNISGIIKAYHRWLKMYPSAPPLFVAGGKGWYYQNIFELVNQLNLQDRVHFPGYIPQQDLPLWYNAAEFLVYPSLFEGFGLPVLESMACGTPVITSNVSSLPEVAGNAALQVEPEDVPALSEAMHQLHQQAELRHRLSKQGLQRASRFSWAETARQTIQVYNQVLHNEVPA